MYIKTNSLINNNKALQTIKHTPFELLNYKGLNIRKKNNYIILTFGYTYFFVLGTNNSSRNTVVEAEPTRIS